MLEQYLTQNAFGLVLVFARLGMIFMLLPGMAASYVPSRFRLLLAIMVTLALYPVIAPSLPPPPASVPELGLLMGMEVFYGAYLGLLSQAVMAALHFAGTAIGRETGMMNAMVFDPVTEQQGALVIGLLSNVAVLLVFVTGLHHLMLEAVVGSYDLFVPGRPPVPGDHLAFYVDILQRSFDIGTRLVAPFIVFALLFQSSMGVMARLAPQFNVFFVALPLQLMLGLGLLWMALPAIMLWFLGYFEDTFEMFLG
jgi:flagellar biosynthetic protein FliR